MRTTVGPLPPSVYWRRRIIVLAIVLLPFAGLRMCVGGSGSDTARMQSANQSTQDGSSAHPYVPYITPIPAKPSASPSPSPTRSVPVTAVRGPTPACFDANLALTAGTDARTYAAGVTPQLSMTVQNVTSWACRRDLGTAAREFVITSGPAHTWASHDCGPRGGSALVTLSPGASQTFTVSWPRQRSQPGCPGAPTVATPGTYRLQAKLGTLVSDQVVFHLA